VNPIANYEHASTDWLHQLLVSAGFEPSHVSLTSNPRTTPLPEGLPAWLSLFMRSLFLRNLGDEEAESVINEVSDMCATDCKDGAGNGAIVYTRLRFSAIMKETVRAPCMSS
jgi:hypothetical protein